MAIQENRLSIESIASLIKVDFNTTEEIVENDQADPTEEPEASSSLDKKPNVTTSPADEAQGVHKTTANDKYNAKSNMSKVVKTKQATKSNTRKFVQSDTTSIDEHLTNTEPINTSHDILSASADSKLDLVVNKSIGSLKLNKFGIKEDKIADKVKAQLVAGIRGVSGFANMNKIHLDGILNDCYRDGINFGGSDWLSSLTNSSMIDEIACGSLENAIAMINEIIGGTPEGRAVMLRSIKNSLNKNDDSEVVNKLFLTKVIVDNAASDEERSLLRIQSRGITDKVLNNVSSSEYKTNSSGSDNKNIKDGLDALDPNWRNDENGDTNYHKVGDNKKMQELASNDLANRHNVPETLGGPVQTTMTDSMCMKICSF